MEAYQKIVSTGTPLNPTPQHPIHRRLPPSTLPIKYKLNPTPLKVPTASKLQPKPPIPSISSKTEINSPRLPVVCIRNNRTPHIKTRSIKYSKFSPRVFEIKPIFHERNRSYNNVGDDLDEFREIKTRIQIIDY